MSTTRDAYVILISFSDNQFQRGKLNCLEQTTSHCCFHASHFSSFKLTVKNETCTCTSWSIREKDFQIPCRSRCNNIRPKPVETIMYVFSYIIKQSVVTTLMFSRTFQLKYIFIPSGQQMLYAFSLFTQQSKIMEPLCITFFYCYYFFQ